VDFAEVWKVRNKETDYSVGFGRHVERKRKKLRISEHLTDICKERKEKRKNERQNVRIWHKSGRKEKEKLRIWAFLAVIGKQEIERN
jgi:hypothetical protein